MRTRIKVCGITRPEDAAAAVRLGIDAIGMVFYPASKRALSLEQAAVLNARLPAFVTRVALFLEPDAAQVRAVIDAIRPDLLQFHGRETPEFCSAFGWPYIKALGLAQGSPDPHLEAQAHVAAIGFLLDSHVVGQAGGTGTAFDWSKAPDDLGRPLILAGGLNPANVAAAIRQLHPYAVDVSSGVESAAGIKDAGKMQEFVQQVRLADAAE